MADIVTDVRVIVRVLLRSATSSAEPAMVRRIGDYVVYVSGEAVGARWPGLQVRSGDLEGIVWTTPRQVPMVVNNLRSVQGVIDARAEAASGGGPPPAPPALPRPPSAK